MEENYYVIIFTTIRTEGDNGYEEMNEETFRMVEKQQGYLGADSYKNENGENVTIVKFKTKEDIRNWKENSKHQEAQKLGREKWYKYYNVKVCRVEREYEFNK